MCQPLNQIVIHNQNPEWEEDRYIIELDEKVDARDDVWVCAHEMSRSTSSKNVVLAHNTVRGAINVLGLLTAYNVPDGQGRYQYGHGDVYEGDYYEDQFVL